MLSCDWLCNPMDYSPPGSSVHRISQARILEWVAICFSRGSSWPRGWTCVSSIAGRFFTTESPGKFYLLGIQLALSNSIYPSITGSLKVGSWWHCLKSSVSSDSRSPSLQFSWHFPEIHKMLPQFQKTVELKKEEGRNSGRTISGFYFHDKNLFQVLLLNFAYISLAKARPYGHS